MKLSTLCYSEKQENIATVTFDRGKTCDNIADKLFFEELNQCLGLIESKDYLEGLVFSSSGKNFMIGSDIREFSALSSSEDARSMSVYMNQTMERISLLSIPVVCLIHGKCLGPGLELALACDWRLLSDSKYTCLGFPEILLGLIPCAGGCRRLPRIIGLQAAVDMILTGRIISAQKSLRNGLADLCLPESILRSEGHDYFMDLPKSRDKQSGRFRKDLSKWAIDGNLIGRKMMFRKSRELVDEKTNGFYPASYKALEAVFDGYDLSGKAADDLSARLFGDLIRTRQSQSLIHLSYANSEHRHHLWYKSAKKKSESACPDLVGIIGAGFIGSGISTMCVNQDIRVVLADESSEAIGRSLRHTHQWITKKVDRYQLQPFELYRKMAFISPSQSSDGIEKAQLVIEAVDENKEKKQSIAKEITSKGSSDLIFASHTSTVLISEIAEMSKYPGQVIGLRFFTPVESASLLEIIITDQTEPWVIGRCLQFAKAMDKKTIVVRDTPGFYTIRTLALYLSEALLMVSEGCPVDKIDQALVQFGFQYGPLSLLDEIGLDICLPVIRAMESSFSDKIKLPEGIDEIYQSGRMGKKNGKGFYRYVDEEKPVVDSDVCRMLCPDRMKGPSLHADEILERCLMAFVNESSSCLEENTLMCASDGDLGAVYGLGFPPFWGGPFKYVDFVGAHHIIEVLKRLEIKYGNRFRPSGLLIESADKRKKFFPDEPWQYVEH